MLKVQGEILLTFNELMIFEKNAPIFNVDILHKEKYEKIDFTWKVVIKCTDLSDLTALLRNAFKPQDND